MKKEFKTVRQIESYVSKIKKDSQKLNLKYPELSGGSVHINNLDIDLLYKVYDYINKDKKTTYLYSSNEKIEHKNDRLNLWVWSKFGIMTFLSSVLVVKDCECVDRKEFKPKQEVKETV